MFIPKRNIIKYAMGPIIYLHDVASKSLWIRGDGIHPLPRYISSVLWDPNKDKEEIHVSCTKSEKEESQNERMRELKTLSIFMAKHTHNLFLLFIYQVPLLASSLDKLPTSSCLWILNISLSTSKENTMVTHIVSPFNF